MVAEGQTTAVALQSMHTSQSANTHTRLSASSFYLMHYQTHITMLQLHAQYNDIPGLDLSEDGHSTVCMHVCALACSISACSFFLF